MNTPLRVALTYNVKRFSTGEFVPVDYYSEYDSQKSIDAIRSALIENGCSVTLVEADGRLLDRFTANRDFDIIFNIAEGTNGVSREAQVPAILDYLNTPYTGSGVLTLTLALNKALSKMVFKYHGLPTPNFQLFKSPSDAIDSHLRYPLIVKPNREGSSKGLTVTSVVHDEKGLRSEVDRISTLYEQEALVEEYIEGRELTIGILGNDELEVLPALEIDFSSCKASGEFFYSWKMKEYQGDKGMGLTPTLQCPARLNDDIAKRVSQVARGAYRALGCLDFSRVDIRLGEDGIPYILEVNPLPGLDPKESNLTFITKSCGMEYDELINTILTNALKRYGHKLVHLCAERG